MSNECTTGNAWSAPNKGWECPKCGKCWAPTFPGCLHCNRTVGHSFITDLMDILDEKQEAEGDSND